MSGSPEAIADAERRLRTFNQKAEHLNNSRFLAAVRSGKTSYRWLGLGGSGVRAERNLPHQEEIEAFVLTLRMFVQDRDGISIRAVATLYERLPLPRALIEEVQKIRSDLNAFLDGLTPFVLQGEALTRRRVMDTMLYGGLSHVDPTKQPEYERWRRDELLFTAIEAEFVDIVCVVTQAVFWVRQANLRASEHLTPGFTREGLTGE
jgi:hypothetical protein